MARSKLHIKICSEFSFLDPLKNVYKIKNFGNLYLNLKFLLLMAAEMAGGGVGSYFLLLTPLVGSE